MNKTNSIKNITAAVKGWRFALAAIVAVVFAVSTARAEIVSEWNQEAVRLTILPASNLAPVQQTRTMAIVQVSVHDAVNGITGKYETYLPRVPAPANATPEAAAMRHHITS